MSVGHKREMVEDMRHPREFQDIGEELLLAVVVDGIELIVTDPALHDRGALTESVDLLHDFLLEILTQIELRRRFL
jgi:hypothetical protein